MTIDENILHVIGVYIDMWNDILHSISVIRPDYTWNNKTLIELTIYDEDIHLYANKYEFEKLKSNIREIIRIYSYLIKIYYI